MQEIDFNPAKIGSPEARSRHAKKGECSIRYEPKILHFKTSEDVGYEKFIGRLSVDLPEYDQEKFVVDRSKIALAKDLFARCEELRDEYELLVDSLDCYIDFDTKFMCITMCCYTYPLCGESKDMIGEMMLESDAVDMWMNNDHITYISFEFGIWKD